MTYGKAIVTCRDIENHSEDEVLEAVEKILGMETINAVSKEELLNIIRWFWKRCVVEEE